MQVPLVKPQLSPSQKIKNILIRSFNRDRQDKNPYQPEASHILKYSPKYYKSLSIEIKPYSPLLSKVKKIKKLKKFEGRTGNSFKEILPQNLWFNLLMNSRKDVEESPQIIPNNLVTRLRRSVWRRFNLQRIKLFPNVSSIALSDWKIDGLYPPFIRYIWNLRRLKSLGISVWGGNSNQANQLFESLEERGRRLLGRLENFFAEIELEDVNFRELFQNKKFFSHLTALRLTGPFDPIFTEIPKACKNLKCLSLDFQEVDEKPEFLDLLNSIHRLDKLKQLEFFWPRDSKKLWGWGHFKPQPSLRKLALTFRASQFVNGGLEPKNMVEHWEEIQELDYLELNVECYKPEEAIFVKQFITMVLKKVRKLCLLKYAMFSPIGNVEPFFVEDVPHLYESLEKFEFYFSNQNHYSQELAKFDLKMMKPFRNLKKSKLEGQKVIYDNVEEIMAVMEENQKEDNETSVLEISTRSMFDQDWLRETLKKIKKTRSVEKNLDMQINLTFHVENPVELLEKLCKEIPVGVIRKGLVISLRILNFLGVEPLSVERVKEILNKDYRNLKLFLKNGNSTLEYRKLDGEQERFYFD